LIDVIIPVYRGLAETRRCLLGVLGAACTVPREVVVVDDASPEPGMADFLRGLAAERAITLLTNAVNGGFVRTVNAGMALHGERDVVLLNSDTEVADGWLDRIVACGARDPRAGTVTPFSNNATICSFPEFAVKNELPPGTTTRSLDRLFAEANAGRAVEIPTAVGFCMWISRRCLAAVGLFDEAAFGRGYGEEVDFCMRASRAGFRHWLAADTFVYHAGEVSFGGSGAERRAEAQRIVDERYPEFQPAVRDFIARDPPKALRDSVLARLAPARPSATPSAHLREAVPEGLVVSESVRTPGLLAIVVADDPAALEATVRGLVEKAVIPGLSVCLVAPAAMPARARAALAQLAASLAPHAACGVLPALPGGDFAATLRAAIAPHPERDVVLVAPGAALPFTWDARLAKAARAEAAVAAAVPMCDVSPLFALVDEKRRADPQLDAAAVDRTLYAMCDRGYYEVPALHAACAYLRRDALDAALPHVGAGCTGPVSLLDALARRFRATGSSSVVCDYVYVGYTGSPAAVAPPSGFDTTAFLRDHPLGGVRRAVGDAIERGLSPVSTPGLDHRPVLLHVMHFWGGGLERWVRDFGQGDPSRINMILATYRIGESGGQRIVLYADPAARVPIRTWDIARPIRSTAAGSVEYRRILAEVVDEFDVEAIVVSSLIGHSLDALAQLSRTIVVCHDFYPVCQAINPMFGTTCTRCTPDDLARCAASNPLNEFFDDQTSDEWHELRELYATRLLAGGIEVVVPSPSVAATLRQLSPRLAGVPMRVIPHGIDLAAPRIAPAPREAGEPLRIVALGLMSRRKGADLLRAAAAGLRGVAEVTLVGGGEAGAELARACGWRCIEHYAPDALPELLRGIAPHAGLLASVVPESFSYTLSELTGLGIPPLATALGSFRDRIVDGENGFLFAPEPGALVALVRRLHAQADLLAHVARNLAVAPPGRTTAEMVADYRALLPLGTRPVARFRVGVGRQTGLTEPYRHLTAAYAELTEAYEQTKAAYESTSDHRAAWVAFVDEIMALELATHPWRYRRAIQLVATVREKLHSREPRRASGADDAAK
jgi:GT2 family glycosyltransferase/glycosyltransferase involved in cell wall biosynthesis